MADVKISELPALTTVLTTALLAVVSAGTTYKATVDDIFEALPLDGSTLSNSETGLKVATGGITNNELATGAVDLSTSKVTGLLPFANIADGSALSVFGRSANSSGVMASIVAADDAAVLRRSGTSIGFGTIATAGIGDNQVTLAKLATQAALTVLANATNGTAVPTAVAASADHNIFRRSGTALAFGAIDLSQSGAVGSSLLAHANIANLTGLSVFGRSANTSGVMAAITGTDGQVLRVSGTTLGFGALAAGAYANNTIPLAALVDAAATSVLGRSAGTTGARSDIAASADGQVLRRASGTVGFGALDLADIDAVTGLLPHANFANGSARSVFGRSANSSGVMAPIAGGGANTVLVDNGTTLAFVALGLATLPTIATDSLLGRDTAGTGAVEVISLNATLSMTGAGALQRAALTGDVTASAGSNATTIANGAVTFAKFQNIATGTLLGRDTAGTGGVEEIVLNQTLEFTGSDALQRAALTGDVTASAGSNATTIANNAVSMAKLADLAGLSLIGRSANTTGDPAAITGTDGQIPRVSGTTLGFGHSLGASGSTFTYNGLTHVHQIAGVASLTLSANTLELGSAVTSLRFAAAVVAPSIQINTSAAAAAVGTALVILGQDMSGTGATVGGELVLRAGNATNGTGGPFETRSGMGATATTAGNWSASIGNVVFLRYPGTVIPATTGILRSHHNAIIVSGRDGTNLSNRHGVRWGETTSDTWAFGDSAVATEVLGSAVQIGDSTTMLMNFDIGTDSGSAFSFTGQYVQHFVAGSELSWRGGDTSGGGVTGNFFQFFGSTGDTITGDKVIYIGANASQPGNLPAADSQYLWCDDTGLRTLNALNGSWTFAPISHLNRVIRSNFVETTSTTITTILSVDTSTFGSDVSGIVEVYVTCVTTVGLVAQKHTFSFTRGNGTLDAPGALTLDGGATTNGTVSASASGANLLIRITAVNSTNYRWDAMAVITYGNRDNAAA
ncbi:MAG TPA: hypothetical protein VJN18_32760 [Polyangiaceae bacterium]|nr:hypothetical protein [Polyangiaceae bacterium]